MNRSLTLAGAVLITAALSACSPGIHTLGNSITFDSNGMVIHSPGHPDAHISRSGTLSIGGRTIAVTPAQRQLLTRYYGEATAVMESGEAMGKRGVSMAARGIGDAISSIFHHDSTTADKRMEAESKVIESAAGKLCADVKALGATRNAIAADIPAFAPYASSDRMQCEVTHSITRKANGAPSSSFVFALREGQAAPAAMPRASSQQTGRSNPPTASQP
ncbi:MAG TPA: DUF2884 family protein [Rhodanobacteraceae bacterium]|nr:DUF2884 family protein [Rhodanobacteraceae bacterium]